MESVRKDSATKIPYYRRILLHHTLDLREFVLCGAVFLLGFILRVYRLGYQSFWTDEILTYSISRLQPGEILTTHMGRNFPPLYYLIVHPLLKFGSHESLLRFPSLVFGSLCIPLLYLVLRKWQGKTVALTGAIIMAISPFHVWYSQEARPYALLLFLSILAVYLLQLLIEKPENLWIRLCFIAVTTATFYVHYIGVAFIGFVGIYTLVSFNEQTWRYRLTTCAGVGLLMTPALYRILTFVPNQSANAAGSFHLASLPYVIWAFGTGYSLGPSLSELHMPDRMSIVLSHVAIIIPVILFLSFLFLFGCLRLWQTDRRLLVCIGLWFFFPLISAVVGSIFTTHVFNVRYAIMAFPAFITLLAVGSNSFSERWQRLSIVAAVIVISVISCVNYYFDEKYHRDNNRAAAAMLSIHARNNDMIISSAAYTSSDLKYYYKGKYNVEIVGYPREMGRKKDANTQRGSSYFNGGNKVDVDFERMLEGKERFWLFLSRTYHSDPFGYIKYYCESRYDRTMYQRWNNGATELILYEGQKVKNVRKRIEGRGGREGRV